ncbi:MAG: rhomboid family intramembrane serine protease [Chitinophagaceae bacterium]
MGVSGIVSILIIAVTSFLSYKGFNSSNFYAKMEFEVEKVLLHRDYKRLFTSAFVHVNWQHLILNMICLLFFSFNLEASFGPIKFLALYTASIVGGNLLTLLIHRKNGGYSSVGASGAINGLIFASIVISPGLHIFFLPGWLFGLIYIMFSIYGIRSGKDNIGHETHLAGALIGMLMAIAFHHEALVENTIPILLMFLPTVAFMMIIITKPQVLFVDNFWYNHKKYNYTVDDRYNARKRNSEQEVDRILDKINQQGINSLSRRERESLEEYSRK